MPEYQILNIPLLALQLAASRFPRMQETAQAEYGDWTSRETAIGNWQIDPKDGKPLHSSGRNLEQDLEAWLKPRPHALVPVTLEDPVDDTWTTPNLTKRGARLKHLRTITGSDAAALVMLTEEANRYGVRNPLSTEVGTAPGEKPKSDGAKPVASNNPWGNAYVKHHGQDAAYAERARLQKTLGLKTCIGMAAACGLSITGAQLRAK
jgi:hypothetical protein